MKRKLLYLLIPLFVVMTTACDSQPNLSSSSSSSGDTSGVTITIPNEESSLLESSEVEPSLNDSITDSSGLINVSGSWLPEI